MVQLSPSLLTLQDRYPTIITVHSSRRHGDPISSLVPFSYLSLHPLTYSAYVVLLPSTYLLPHQQHHQPISHHPFAFPTHLPSVERFVFAGLALFELVLTF